LHLVQRDQVWNTFWNTQTKNGGVLSSKLTTAERVGFRNLVNVCSS
jgi:hypothetical protein